MLTYQMQSLRGIWGIKWGSSGIQVGFPIGARWLLDWNLASRSDPSMVQDLRIAQKLFFQNSSQIPLISKGQKQADLHSAMDAPEPLQCEDWKLTFSLEAVCWMQEGRKNQLSQGIVKDLLSGSKIQTVLFRQYIANVLSGDLPYFK